MTRNSLDEHTAFEIGRSGSEHFAEHGWWISPMVLTSQQLDELERGLARFFRGEYDWDLPAKIVEPQRPMELSVHDYVCLRVAEVRNYVLGPVVGPMLAGISRHSGIRLFHDGVLLKRPGEGGRLGWHSDASSWSNSSSATEMLAAWTPLCDVDEGNGALQVIDGSHGAPLDHSQIQDVDKGAAIPVGCSPEDLVTFCMQRGQISFHHSRTVHGSPPNHSSCQRMAFSVFAQPLENHFIESAAAGDGLSMDQLCRRDTDGLPDYSDPWVCPRLYQGKPD